MGRILVICPQQGLLEMVSRILSDAHEVEAFPHYQAAENRLAAKAAYETVLCGLDDPDWAIRIFAKAAECSTDTRLIPIAKDAAQFDQFLKLWTGDAQGNMKRKNIGRRWLPEHFTVGDLHALLPACGNASDNLPSPEPDLPADGGSAAKETQKKSPGRSPLGPPGAAPQADNDKAELALETPRTLGIGTIIDGYRLLRSIGQGGFGAIWMCANGTSEEHLAIVAHFEVVSLPSRPSSRRLSTSR